MINLIFIVCVMNKCHVACEKLAIDKSGQGAFEIFSNEWTSTPPEP